MLFDFKNINFLAINSFYEFDWYIHNFQCLLCIKSYLSSNNKQTNLKSHKRYHWLRSSTFTEKITVFEKLKLKKGDDTETLNIFRGLKNSQKNQILVSSSIILLQHRSATFFRPSRDTAIYEMKLFQRSFASILQKKSFTDGNSLFFNLKFMFGSHTQSFLTRYILVLR